VKWISFENL